MLKVSSRLLCYCLWLEACPGTESTLFRDRGIELQKDGTLL
jgi:hypothetical protein